MKLIHLTSISIRYNIEDAVKGYNAIDIMVKMYFENTFFDNLSNICSNLQMQKSKIKNSK